MKRILSGADAIHRKDAVGCYVTLMRAEQQRAAVKYIKQKKNMTRMTNKCMRS